MIELAEVRIKPKPNKTTTFMRKLNDILYLCGLRNFWVEPERFSNKFTSRYNVVSNIIHVTAFGFVILLLSGFITQKNLTKKQQADIVVNLANPFSQFYCFVFIYHSKLVREILYRLIVDLKEDQNDVLVERGMIRKLKVYLIVFIGSGLSALIGFGVYGVYQKIQSGQLVTFLI